METAAMRQTTKPIVIIELDGGSVRAIHSQGEVEFFEIDWDEIHTFPRQDIADADEILLLSIWVSVSVG
jgi:hypothetical protein